jgi:hypothetical protein
MIFTRMLPLLPMIIITMEGDVSESEEEDIVYMQAPNVPKDQVRDCLRKLKLQVQQEKAARAAAAEEKKSKSDEW